MTGAQVFRAKDAPQYLSGLTICAVAFALQFLVALGWRLYYIRQNRLRDEAAFAAGWTAEEQERMGRELGEKDTTDGCNPSFRYTL